MGVSAEKVKIWRGLTRRVFTPLLSPSLVVFTADLLIVALINSVHGFHISNNQFFWGPDRSPIGMTFPPPPWLLPIAASPAYTQTPKSSEREVINSFNTFLIAALGGRLNFSCSEISNSRLNWQISGCN